MESTQNSPDFSSAVEDPGRRSGRWHSLRRRGLHEARRFLALFLYLWLMSGLFALHDRIILREHGLAFTQQGLALVNAFVLAKVMLVAEDLNLGRWLRRRRQPLIILILYEAFVFAIIFLCFHVLEHVVIGWIKGESLEASTPAIGGGGLVGLILVAAILFVALVPYFAFQNVSRVLGREWLNALLFRAPEKGGPPAAHAGD